MFLIESNTRTNYTSWIVLACLTASFGLLLTGHFFVKPKPQPTGWRFFGFPRLADPAPEAAAEPANVTPPVAKDISKELSEQALAVLCLAQDKGYQVRFSPDKSSIVVAMDGWQTSLSSDAEILKFGRDLR